MMPNDKKSQQENQERAENTILNNSIARPYLIILLLFSLYLAFLILRPFLHTIIFAIVLVILFRPAYRRILQAMPNRKTVAAGLSTIAITVCILIPLVLFAAALFAQGLQVTEQIREWFAQGGLQQLQGDEKVLAAWDYLQKYLPSVDLEALDLRSNILSLTKSASEFLLSNSASIVGNVANLVINFAIMLFILFYLLRDGDNMLLQIKHLSPLRERQENLIFKKIQGVTYSVLAGSILTAMLQGVVGGIGMAIVGIPALFWGTMLAFSSLVPIFGTAIIWIPSTVYLLLMGYYKSAIFFALWSALLVGSIDNFVRPFLMKGHGGMSTFTIFLAILGGIQIFGIAGLLYGPLIFGFALVMLALYQDEYCKELKEDSCDHE